MYQPQSLATDDYLPWSRGRGHDVWGMLRASADGDLATVQNLVAREPTLVNCEFHYYRPLHMAVRENRVDVARFLIDKGADPMCSGLGFEPAWRPANPGNFQWPPTMARQRGYVQMQSLLDGTLRDRFYIRPEGETIANLIRSRDLAQVQSTLDAHPDWLNAADGFGSQPIHWATMTRQLDLIDLLLERGAEIDATRPDGARPLDLTNGDYHYRGWRDVPDTALQRHEAVIGHLLARGAYYDISTAASLGDLDRVRILLAENPQLANMVPASTGYYQGAPLRCAAKRGHMAVVRLLLEHGADPNLPEPVAPYGGALYEAIGGKHWEIVRLLLARGANADGAVESSGTCFWRAKRDAAPAEILKLLATHGACLNLEMASYDEDIELLATMLRANPKLPIHDHLPTGNEQIVKLAMKYQPDVLTRVEFSGAPSVEYARWLVKNGIDAVSPNWLGITPLHRFALKGEIDMARLCLEAGAHVNAIDDEYASTPLGWAARGGKTEMVRWLLNQGADRTLPNDRPWATPLAWAMHWRHAETITALQ